MTSNDVDRCSPHHTPMLWPHGTLGFGGTPQGACQPGTEVKDAKKYTAVLIWVGFMLYQGLYIRVYALWLSAMRLPTCNTNIIINVQAFGFCRVDYFCSVC